MNTREITLKDLEVFNVLMQLKEQSKCLDKQVACVIVNENYNIVSTGVNTIKECNKDCHSKRDRICDVTHAEVMAIDNLGLDKYNNSDLKAYVSLCPCTPCQQILNEYTNEIIYFGMTHKDIDPEIEHKITRFDHLSYNIFCKTNADDFVRHVSNTLDNLKESIHYGKDTYIINQIVETEIQLEQLKLWVYESNNEFYNKLRERRSEILKDYIEATKDEE